MFGRWLKRTSRIGRGGVWTGGWENGRGILVSVVVGDGGDALVMGSGKYDDVVNVFR